MSGKGYAARYAKERRKKAADTGVCIQCFSSPAAVGKKQCRNCLERAVTTAREKRKAGICTSCAGVAAAGGVCSKHYQSRKRYRRERYIMAKREVLQAYGSHCACCWEDEVSLLSIDHVNNRGFADSNTGYALFRSIIKQGFPNTFQLLCHNCNSSKHYGRGECIHQRIKRWNTLF